MARIRIQKKHIQIERNVIEKSLMMVKDFLKAHKRIVLYVLIGAVAVSIIAVAVSLITGKISDNERIRYEQLMAKYYASEGNGEGTLRAINEFRDFVDSSHTFFIENTGPYIVGNMYFTNKMYKEARQYLLKYVNDSPETELTPLAVLKAAVASEELNDFDKSISLLQRLESEYKGSIIGDQIYYHIARYYLKKNDTVNAKKYLEREITAFPMSPYALLAKERLLLLNITEKK